MSFHNFNKFDSTTKSKKKTKKNFALLGDIFWFQIRENCIKISARLPVRLCRQQTEQSATVVTCQQSVSRQRQTEDVPVSYRYRIISLSILDPYYRIVLNVRYLLLRSGI